MGSHLERVALNHLRKSVNNPEVMFRTGQWEAIEALVERSDRLLVVQRTGWGKSLVYFIATRLLRDRGAGPTLLISPLLALMRNQIEAAEKAGIQAMTINSSNSHEWSDAKTRIRNDDVDILLISPERLSNDEFRGDVLSVVANRVGLFVVDEAHCISDWGHDFRPDYKRITRVLQAMPANVPVLTTIATANDRVINDIVEQLGPDLTVFRGQLGRESLQLQTIDLPDQAARLAWLSETLPQLPGRGIVYTLTIRDTERVAGCTVATRAGCPVAADDPVCRAQLQHG
jgi:ATP-dependent DNA helicase RecQ